MRLLVTRDDYFAAAMKLLGKQGAGALKIAPLCKALKVTTGSFYGYFGSFDGFVAEFLDYWEEAQTKRIVELSNAPSDPAERIHLMKELTAGLPHEAEAAIRSWAHTNRQVAEAQRRVDARRQDALTEILVPVVGSVRLAQTLAMMGLTLLVGLQQLRSPVTRREFDPLFNEYEQVIFAHAEGRAAAS
ncbi:TetR/AcrR family transcriptional regulator [Skermania sp. ID1734]|uniref:TetR/AcrR family transcriptional regulator n=1 Tax=Skermania sp. ID1734 TaxID=2597516 RepID=UPI00117EC745|nr:TetR/AcrR family transcriptional regulator [Skermania sp. ID1734]TSE01476.1 TetR/AcrR family transcriptional regulator [Skermania sp. ID1734]